MSEDRLRAAIAAGVLSSAERHRDLLGSIVEVARSIFAARASSVLLYDEQTDELVFEATAGEGEVLRGRRFPAGRGIAGWVLGTRTPLVIEDVRADPRFAVEISDGVGYMPAGLMAVPLLYDERALGVLEVLDRPQDSRFSLSEMELLGLFANQAAIALDLLRQARAAESLLAGTGDLALVARIAASLDGLDETARPAAFRLLTALDDLLGPPHR